MFNLFKKEKDILVKNADGTFTYSPKNKGWTCKLIKYPDVEILIKGYELDSSDSYDSTPFADSLNSYLSKYEYYLNEAYKMLQDTIRNDENNKSFSFNKNQTDYFKVLGVLFDNLDNHSFVLAFEDKGKLVSEGKGYIWSVHFTDGKTEGVSIDS